MGHFKMTRKTTKTVIKKGFLGLSNKKNKDTSCIISQKNGAKIWFTKGGTVLAT